MSKVDYRPQQNNTAYWRNVANEGRGSQMTQCLHEACDYVARLESESAEMAELLDDACAALEMGEAETRSHVALQIRALLARIDQ